MASSEPVDNSFILSTFIIFLPLPGIWFAFFKFVIFLIPLCVPFFYVRPHPDTKIGFDRGILSFLLVVCMLLWLSICDFVSWNTYISKYPAEFHCFPDCCRSTIMCFGFRIFWLVGICFWSACRQLFESVNIETLFLLLQIMYSELSVLHVILIRI